MPNLTGLRHSSDITRSNFRIVPPIETYPKFLAFAETAIGQLLTLVIFACMYQSFALSATFTLDSGWTSIVAIFLLGLPGASPAFRLLMGSLWSMCYMDVFSLDSGLSIVSYYKMNAESVERFRGKINQNFYAYKAVVFFGTCALIAFSSQALKQLRTRLPIFWIFPFWLALLIGLKAIEPNSTVMPFALGIFTYFSFAIIPLCYFQLARNQAASFPEWKSFSFLLQGQLVNPKLSYINLPGMLSGRLAPRDLAACRLKAIKLLFWTRGLLLLKDMIYRQFFVVWHWPNYARTGFNEYNSLHVPALQSVTLVFLNSLNSIFYFAVSTGVAVSLIRLTGIYIPRGFYRPYLAKSLTDYFRRILYFYSEIIVHIFWYPLDHLFAHYFKNRWLRISISLYLAIFLGGWIFHLVCIWSQLFVFGSAGAMASIVSWAFYFSLVSAACCLSLLVSKLKPLPFQPAWPLRCAAFFGIYSLIHFFFQYDPGYSWADRLDFFRSLF